MNRYRLVAHVLVLIALAAVPGLTAQAADAPRADADNGSWRIRADDFFAAGKPLNIYITRKEGKWLAAVATSRIPGGNHYGYNVAKYVADVSGVQVNADTFKGPIKLKLTPDPWVPADHKPRSVVLEVDGKLGNPNLSAKTEIRSVQGSYKANLEAGIRDKDKESDINGTLGGGIDPPQAGDPDELSYELVFHQTDDDSNLWVKLGIKKGAIASANVGRVNFQQPPSHVRGIDAPKDVQVSMDSVAGKLVVPDVALDGAALKIEVEFKGSRVGNFLSGTYKATLRTGGEVKDTRENCFDGLVVSGVSPNQPGLDERPWQVPVKDWKPPQAGEHPRLLFRKSDLPMLRERAKTPEGKALIERLRRCLNGSDGESMPTAFNPEKGPVKADGAGDFHPKAPLGAYTFSHMAGYGMLYQLTGEKKYADLGKQCFEKALEGYRDRDRRYAFQGPFGSLRAGPVLGWTALGYDLCYDGWDEEFRKKVCRALATYADADGRGKVSLSSLVHGDMPPASNHFGMQVGGATLALLAISKDPDVDQEMIERLLAVSQKSIVRNLSEGFGDGGFFAEGDGTGSMSSHIVFLTALQAWRVAGGKDFAASRPNASWTALKWIFLTIPREGQMEFLPKRGGYPHNVWDRGDKSGAGYFALSFGALGTEHQAALLWFYNHHLKAADADRGTPFDTPCPYPHLAVCAFVNWPMQLKEKNPAEVLPLCYRDSKWGFYAFRNRWQDENDALVSVLTKNARGYIQARADGALHVTALGKKFSWGTVKPDVTFWKPAADGSGIMSFSDGTSLAVDFSRASGADLMLATTGTAEGTKVVLGATTVTLKFVSSVQEPKPQVKGDQIVVGDQSITLKDGNIVLGKMAEPRKEGPSK